jgi:hypothetical protein
MQSACKRVAKVSTNTGDEKGRLVQLCHSLREGYEIPARILVERVRKSLGQPVIGPIDRVRVICSTEK